MVNRKGILLVASSRMDENKRDDRRENDLIRLSATARRNLGFVQGKVELSAEDKEKDVIVLNIFQAFAADIRDLKNSGEYKSEDIKCVGFVTTSNLNKICGKDKKKVNIWVSDGVENTVIGTDPEFLLFEEDGKKIINANNTGLNHLGIIGYDGAMAEIRPAPESSIDNLVKNMKDIFENDSLTGCIKNLSWMAGCYYKNESRDFPIGGHIHIGNPIKIAEFTEQKRVCLFIVINKILDELLAIPMIKLDGDLGKIRRTNTRMSRFGGYGFFGEWRMCQGRLEHRTLSGMWLKHPSIAKAVLGTAKAITDEVFKLVEDKDYNYNYFAPQNIRNIIKMSSPDNIQHKDSVWKSDFDGWKDIPLSVDMKCLKSSQEMRNTLNNSNAGDINKPFLDKWLTTMKTLSTYNNYKKYILGLYEILLIPTKDLSNFDKKIQKNWLEGNPFHINI